MPVKLLSVCVCARVRACAGTYTHLSQYSHQFTWWQKPRHADTHRDAQTAYTLKHTESAEKTEEGRVDQMEQPASCWASLTTAEQLEVYRSGRPQTHSQLQITHTHTHTVLTNARTHYLTLLCICRRVTHKQRVTPVDLRVHTNTHALN